MGRAGRQEAVGFPLSGTGGAFKSRSLYNLLFSLPIGKRVLWYLLQLHEYMLTQGMSALAFVSLDSADEFSANC